MYYPFFYVRNFGEDSPHKPETPNGDRIEPTRMLKSRLVREALENAFGQRQIRTATVYDLTRDLCGSVRGGPRDLASNKKHLADYGA